jgi:hypothetical protein
MIDPMAKINSRPNLIHPSISPGPRPSARGWQGHALSSRTLRRPSLARRAPCPHPRARCPLLPTSRRGVPRARVLRRPLLQVILEERRPPTPPVSRVLHQCSDFRVDVLPTPKGRRAALAAHALRRPLLQLAVEERDAAFDRQHC